MAAVGTVRIVYGGLLPVQRVELHWTSDASGNVSGTLTDRLNGALVRAAFSHSGPGGAPTNLYDVTLLDGSGADVLGGQGANLAIASPSHVAPGVPLKDGTTTTTAPVQVDDQLELQVANAGNAKSGVVTLYIR
jgi:hypothetical protein